MIQDAVTHELIHAYDHCRIKMDYGNCYHIACTEIRAANFSLDCKPSREWLRGNLTLTSSLSSFAGHKPKCVRRRALLSLKGVPFCSKDAETFVDTVFQTCYNDLEPFVGIQ